MGPDAWGWIVGTVVGGMGTACSALVAVINNYHKNKQIEQAALIKNYQEFIDQLRNELGQLRDRVTRAEDGHTTCREESARLQSQMMVLSDYVVSLMRVLKENNIHVDQMPSMSALLVPAALKPVPVTPSTHVITDPSSPS